MLQLTTLLMTPQCLAKRMAMSLTTINSVHFRIELLDRYTHERRMCTALMIARYLIVDRVSQTGYNNQLDNVLEKARYDTFDTAAATWRNTPTMDSSINRV